MIETIGVYLTVFIDFMHGGGMAMWVLFVLNLLLWYGLGQRGVILKRKSFHNVRRLVEKHEKEGGARKGTGLLDFAIVDALQAADEARKIGKKPRKFVMDALAPYLSKIKKHSILVRTIVVIAPLIGLLGTVSGMIETFEALETSAMFSQGVSISGGISKALFTTELGLVVAVPGMIIGRILDRKAHSFALEFGQITDIICTREATYEIS